MNSASRGDGRQQQSDRKENPEIFKAADQAVSVQRSGAGEE
jgi:hypothetical protein